ncbi:RsfA family transcriptional regulator [Alicyclobacillus fastidiosus]|uniref:RsfA family transcriptional regulator n=1 Tax=Alicyclobacillus fastidiosus TaxID=392011 RepID=A0ABV5AJ38_9BACL|nr:RsfA family transcriptional regulator [Alicyclobacillus fastidiosus]WEH09344.1 RsfA family transcriptional regulator [Alicyclobacillus fastidiosus]
MQTVEKWASRSDAWTPDDDTRLADLVLKHIRNGSTQLKAFEEAAGLLGRTPAACGYRWNGVVRKDYRVEIEAAKQSRKNGVSEPKHTVDAPASTPAVEALSHTTSESMKDVIDFLQTYDEQYHKLRAYLTQIEQEKHELAERVESLQQQLQTQSVVIEKDVTPEQLEEDSRTLFAIMERARKLLGDTGRPNPET